MSYFGGWFNLCGLDFLGGGLFCVELIFWEGVLVFGDGLSNLEEVLVEI